MRGTAQHRHREAKLLLWQPDSWADAVAVLRDMDGWLFRGQGEAHWRLASSLERVQKSECHGNASMHELEEETLSSFKRQAYHHLQHIPEDKDGLEWLSLVQHHGGPTRLLDFTRSFYVATFFAVEEGEEHAAIWAVNRTYLDGQMMNALADWERSGHQPSVRRGARLIANGSINPTMTEADRAEAEYWESRMPEDCRPIARERMSPVIAVRPWRLNQRMIIQQGWFLFPTDVNSTFETSFCRALGLPGSNLPLKERQPSADALQEQLRSKDCSVGLVKVILEKGIHEGALRDLQRMNISAATLFPGLDGFARSLKASLRLFGRTSGGQR